MKICTYQLICSKECQVCLTGAVCFCPCPQPGLEGSHSVGSVYSAKRMGQLLNNTRQSDKKFVLSLYTNHTTNDMYNLMSDVFFQEKEKKLLRMVEALSGHSKSFAALPDT